MMPQRFEYKVIWKRQGNVRKTSKIHQTYKGALDKCKRLKNLDEAKLEQDHYLYGLAKLEMGPILECRVVGKWQVISNTQIFCQCHPKNPFLDSCLDCMETLYP